MSRSLTPGAKTWLICIVLLGFTASTGAVAVYQIRAMNRQLRSLTENSLPAVYALGKAEGFGKDIRGKLRSYVVADKPSEKKQNEAQFTTLEQQLTSELANYRRYLRDAQERQLFDPLLPSYQRMKSSWTSRVRPVSQAPAHKEEALVLFTKEFLPCFEDFNKKLDLLVAWRRQRRMPTWQWPLAGARQAKGGHSSWCPARSFAGVC